jgi:hypothetical protein
MFFNDLIKILSVLSNDGEKTICKEDCGIHFHISNEYILLNLYGLLFLSNLIILWLTEWQNKFLRQYPYQITRYGKSYDDKNDIKYLDKMLLYKQNIIEHILANDFNNHVFILNIFDDINRINNKTHFLNLYQDYKYIHIEFRGLASVSEFINISSFIEYIDDLKILYDLAIKQSKDDLKTS